MTTIRGRQLHDEPEMTALEQAQMGRKHVLCVNGSSAFLEFVRMLLEEERYNVTTTNFVPATFDQIAVLHPDLLIIDLEVGKRAGWDLLERLTETVETNAIPLIIVSTDASLLERARGTFNRSNGSQFLGKPFNIDDLLGAVHSLIGEA